MSDDSDREDLFGHAISLDGGLLLTGAPKKHLDVPEIQLIVSTGSRAEVRRGQMSRFNKSIVHNGCFFICRWPGV